MRYVAAYCLAAFQGSDPSAKDIEKILGSVGVDCDATNAKKVIDELKGKKLEEIIAQGMGKLGSMPAASAGAASAPSTASKAAAPVEKKEEKKEEPEEESDEDMGFGLFD